ncbi:hypothetical protein NQ317_004114 [Molorchus minor]|uniref:Uncharacterized protein n=1 Tax=Molorchus minor TaxID=1323400 RepID=A0ABQ9J4U3_9CUCU|nr:hypothetical protein NQ317_004114 [Molorchus minor]
MAFGGVFNNGALKFSHVTYYVHCLKSEAKGRGNRVFAVNMLPKVLTEWDSKSKQISMHRGQTERFQESNREVSAPTPIFAVLYYK